MQVRSHARRRTLTLAALAYATVASAQSDSAGAPPQDFATAKAQHIARLQKELECVQAATTLEAMHACRPQPPGGRRGGPPEP